MSSSNSVSLTYTPEVKYGVKADATSGIMADTVRFTSESLSGSPQTTESAALRTDRASSGMVITGLDVGGSIDFELASDKFFSDFFALSMMSSWASASTPVAAVAFAPDPTDNQKGTLKATGVGTGINVGDVIVLVDSAAGAAKSYYTVISKVVGTLTVASKRGQVAVAAGSASRPAFIDIGKDVSSVTLAKAYQDVTHLLSTDQHSQTYSGCLSSGFNISAQYGSIVTGSFSINGNGYEQEYPSREQDIKAGGGTINAAGTSIGLNASIDVPVVTADGEATDFCIESFSLSLDNGLVAQHCIGSIAARRFELGQAAISVDVSVYNSDTSYDKFMPLKLNMAPISMTFVMENDDGGFAFVLNAIQLTGDDPSASGANSPVMLEMSGTAIAPAGGGSAMRIYKL